MTSTAIIQRVDHFGRILIPKEIREQCGLQAGDPVDFVLTGLRTVTLVPIDPHAEYIYRLEQIEKYIKNDLALENRQNILSAIYILKGELRKGAKKEEQNEMA